MGSLEENLPVRKPVARRGQSGEGERPWLAVWLVLLERAMQRAGFTTEARRDWKAALGNFLLDFHRHPAKLTPGEIREYLFRTGELGGAATPRSLSVSTRALAFFYTFVVPRPLLADAARHPFDAPPAPPASLEASPIPAPQRAAWERADAALLTTLREKRVTGGAASFCGTDWGAVSGRGEDWTPIR